MTKKSAVPQTLFLFLGRLAEELRSEQDHALSAAKASKTLHSQSLELQSRLDEVEENAIRHGRKVLAKLEEKVRGLEGELCKSSVNQLFFTLLLFYKLQFRQREVSFYQYGSC